MQEETYGPDGKIDIEPYVEKARKIGGRLWIKYGIWYSVEELESMALMALVKCRDDYRSDRTGHEGRKTSFDSYIVWKIPCDMVDQIREESWVPRLVIARKQPHPEMKSLSAPIDERGLFDKTRTLDQELSDDTHRQDPHLDMAEEVNKELRRFNVTERTILRLYHGLDVPMKKIGRILGLSESRVSQMHSNIMARLKEIHGGPRSRDRAGRGCAHCPRTRKTRRTDGNGDAGGADPGEPGGGEPAVASDAAAEAASG